MKIAKPTEEPGLQIKGVVEKKLKIKQRNEKNNFFQCYWEHQVLVY